MDIIEKIQNKVISKGTGNTGHLLPQVDALLRQQSEQIQMTTRLLEVQNSRMRRLKQLREFMTR